MTLSHLDLAKLIKADSPEGVASWFIGELTAAACTGDDRAAGLCEAGRLYLASRTITSSKPPAKREACPVWLDAIRSYSDRMRAWIAAHPQPSYCAHDLEAALGIPRKVLYGLFGSMLRAGELERVRRGEYVRGPNLVSVPHGETPSPSGPPAQAANTDPPAWLDETLSYTDRVRAWLRTYDLPTYSAAHFDVVGIARAQLYGILGSMCRQGELVRVARGEYELGPNYRPE